MSAFYWLSDHPICTWLQLPKYKPIVRQNWGKVEENEISPQTMINIFGLIYWNWSISTYHVLITCKYQVYSIDVLLHSKYTRSALEKGTNEVVVFNVVCDLVLTTVTFSNLLQPGESLDYYLEAAWKVNRQISSNSYNIVVDGKCKVCYSFSWLHCNVLSPQYILS